MREAVQPGAVTGLAQPPSSSSHHKVPRLQLSLTAYRKAALAKHGSGKADFKARRKLFQGGLQCRSTATRCQSPFLSLKFFRRIFSAFRHPSQHLLFWLFALFVYNRVNQNSSLLGHTRQPGMDSREPVWPNNIKNLSWPRDGITYSYEQRGYIKPEKLARWLEKAFGQGTAKYVVRRLLISLYRIHESPSLLNGKPWLALRLLRLACPIFSVIQSVRRVVS
jgi:hypothetical protein